MAYNLLKTYAIIGDSSTISGDMSSDITSSVIETKEQDNVGFQAQWTGAPVGIFDIQISMDYARDIHGNVTNPGTWTTLLLSNTISANGSADNAYVDINQFAGPFMRMKYTRTSGTGTLTAFVTGKGV